MGISFNDYRGAASVLLDQIQKLRHAGEGTSSSARTSPTRPSRNKIYLLLTNALSCVDPKQAWVFSEDAAGRLERQELVGKRAGSSMLADVRKQ